MSGERVLICTTNGTGMGHLTRGMAIGRRLPEGLATVLFTLSQAAPVARGEGFLVEYLHAAGTAGTNRHEWNLVYARRLEALLATYDPAVVLFDGVHPYLGLLEVASSPRHRHRRFVWSRRGLWQPGKGGQAIDRGAFFDVVLEPGDVAEAADEGLSATRRHEAVVVDPVTLLDADELLDREQARAALGLEPEATWALVQLGTGALDDPASRLGIAAAALGAAGVRLAFVESTIAAQRTALPPGAVGIEVYPLARYLRAFDLAVTAAGYNIVHEALVAGLPTILSPIAASHLDDQVARARYLEEQGLARCWIEPTREAFEGHLAHLADAEARAAVAGRIAARAFANGAGPAAALLAELAGDAR